MVNGTCLALSMNVRFPFGFDHGQGDQVRLADVRDGGLIHEDGRPDYSAGGGMV